jgi:hypothetical protein
MALCAKGSLFGVPAQTALCTSPSALRTLHSAPRAPHSALHTLQSALCALRFALCTSRAALRTVCFALRTPCSMPALCAPMRAVLRAAWKLLLCRNPSVAKEPACKAAGLPWSEAAWKTFLTRKRGRFGLKLLGNCSRASACFAFFDCWCCRCGLVLFHWQRFFGFGGRSCPPTARVPEGLRLGVGRSGAWLASGFCWLPHE